MSVEKLIPVTVLSGTLGAGKTTLLNHVLGGDHDREIAVLVNDVGEVNVDAELVERHTDEEVVELSNGCICCGLQGELARAVIELVEKHEFDYLLVEPSGISEPAPVAKQFVEGRPAAIYGLQSVTTVVNARQFYDAFEEGQPERYGEDSDGTRPISDLMLDGVEFCDRLVINKTDLVSEGELDAVRTAIRTIQPDASIITTSHGQVDPAGFLNCQEFDREGVEHSARWRKVLDGDETESHEHGDEHDERENHEHGHEDHEHPPEEYGVESLIYQRPEPMHPERLADFLRGTPAGLLRAKGWLHVAGRPDHALELSLAGPEAQVTVAGRWIASLPEPRQQLYREQHDPNWTDEYGDRETRLVLIGRKMDVSGLEDRLDSCLLDAETLDPTVENPFPGREGKTLRLPAVDSLASKTYRSADS